MNTPRILIAGIGNIFLGDDAFGVAVVQRLAARPLPDGVRVVDFGIRGLDLAYALLEDYERVIIIDTIQRGGAPGTLYVIEPSLQNAGPLETHEMVPAKALASAKAMGASLSNVIILGCEAASFGSDAEPQMELSPPLAAAIDEAIAMLETLLNASPNPAHA
jgi:hydrogenase maturation protease